MRRSNMHWKKPPLPAAQVRPGGAESKRGKGGQKPLKSQFLLNRTLSPRCLGALLLLVAFTLLLPSLSVAMPKVTAPPEGERWFSVNMAGERVGFARLSIIRAGDGYRIESESAVKMRGMGFTREASSREWYLVRRDLTVRSFWAETRIDGSPMTVKGEAVADGIRMTVESRSGKQERTLKPKGPVYPPQALNVYPLMQGAVTGKTYKIPMLDVESAKIKQVKVKVIGEETLPPGTATVHLRNDLYPIVDNDIWVDLQGNTIKEAIREDLAVTLAEDEKTARQQLADAALSKKDMVLDFSLIPVSPPIERPEQLKRLSVELTGIPEALTLLQGKGQEAIKAGDGRVIFTMPNPAYTAPQGENSTIPADLEATARIPSGAPEIAARKDEIIGTEKDPARKAKLLVEWVAREIKGTVTDSHSPLETLSNRSGNCQGHSRLYTALARTAGIPTRFVSGIVYAPGKGFLYHSWAESFLNGWVPVDPTFGEMPANVTHIKLVEGDSPDEMGALAGVIGRLKARVLEKVY